MSEYDATTTEADSHTDDIARLIRFGGAREAVAEDRYEQARERVLAHWKSVVRERRRKRRQRRLVPLAAAAAMLVVAVAWLGRETASPPIVGEPVVVNRITGEVLVDGVSARPGDVIPRDAVVESTANGRVAMQLPRGNSLRLDTGSRVVFAGAARLRLDRGAVYVDAGVDPGPSAVEISTPFGVARDIGTQFQVRIHGDRLRVGVREGRIEFARPNGSPVSVTAGQTVEIPADGGPAIPVGASPADSWTWVEAIAPEFDIQDATLDAYLRWYARQTGLVLEWQDGRSAVNASQIRLSGSIGGLSLDEGFDLVGRIAPFEAQRSLRALRVRVE